MNLIDDGFLLERTKKGDPLCWRERVPFYRQKRDRFTSERVKVRMLLGFVAHVGGYKITVGAHSTIDVTIECQMHVGGYVDLFGYGRYRYLLYY